jgi:hypothetical protein
MSKIIEIQKILFPDKPDEWDDKWGARCRAALEAAISESGQTTWRSVLASSFADPADVAAFKRCKAEHRSDRECFKYGDNAIGCWGDSTAEGTGPSVALPPEIWKPFGLSARKKPLIVRYGAIEVQCELKDTMPAIANIRNGARIDLNPDCCAALGLTPPIMTQVEWKWAS